MIFFRNVLGTFITEVSIVGLNFFIGVLVARAMSPAARGVLALAMTLPITVAYFIDPGVSQANIYLFGHRRRSAEALAANSILLALVIGVAAGLALWLGQGPLLRTLLSGLTSNQLTLLLPLLPLLLLDSYLMAILRARQQFRLYNLKRLATQILLLALMLLVLLPMGKAATGAILAFSLTMVLSTVLSIVLVGRTTRLRIGLQTNLAGEMVRYGLKSYVQNLVGHLTYRLDLYLVALFLDPAQIAFYAVATSFAELAWYVPNSVGTVLFPRLSIATTEEIHPLTAEITRHTLFVTLILTLGLAAASWIVVPLFYGPTYLPVIAPLLTLLPGVLSMTVYKVLTRNFSSRNRQQVSILASVLALLVNVGLNVWLIPQMGIVGAAASSLVAYTLAGTILLIAFCRESGLPLHEVLLIRRADLAHYGKLVQQVKTWKHRQIRNHRSLGEVHVIGQE
ncbi:MAG: lipopolysaccharide biosynthesis protein [Chloroflexota bacterium]